MMKFMAYIIAHENITEQQHFQRRYASTELQWMNCITGISHDTWECIEWEWHKSLPVNGKNLWNY